MKILVISATYPPDRSGGADYAMRLCEKLSDTGHSIDVITSETPNLVKKDGITLYPIMGKWSWTELPRLLSLARKLAPDVINLHFAGVLYDDHPMISFLPFFIKKLLPNCRFVTLFEAPLGTKAYKFSFFTRGLQRVLAKVDKNIDYSYGCLLNCSDAFIFLSEVHREILAHINPSVRSKSIVLPPPPLVPLTDANAEARAKGRQILNLGDSELVISYFGYIYPGKGLETLLAAFAHIIETRKNAHLVIIGGEPEVILKDLKRKNYLSELRELAEQLNLTDKIIWSGEFASDELRPSYLLRASDLAILPFERGLSSNNSSFATVAQHKLAIISTKAKQIEPQFKDGENVILCPPGDVLAIVNAAKEVIASPELRERLGQNAFKLAETYFSWNKTISETLKLFSSDP